MLAHNRNGTLPLGSVVKLEFSNGQLIFGLKPDCKGLSAYLSLLSDHSLPWMVTLRGGDLLTGFGKLAVERGGHVRVGIEDYGGERTPSNVQLVEEIVELGLSCGRPPASPREAAKILGLIHRSEQ